MEITKDVEELGMQRQDIDEEKLMITTGQALLSIGSFGKIILTLWPSQGGLSRGQASSITTATPPLLWAMGRS